MTSAADVPAWVARWRQRAARRGDRCRVCGHRRTVATEAGPRCAVHAAELPPPIMRADDDQETDE